MLHLFGVLLVWAYSDKHKIKSLKIKLLYNHLIQELKLLMKVKNIFLPL